MSDQAALALDADGRASVRVVIGVVVHAKKILITRRSNSSALGGLWEFPGGKIESGESPHSALQRELFEEVGLCVTIEAALPPFSHAYPHAQVYVMSFLCSPAPGALIPVETESLKWITTAELNTYAFPAGNAELLNALATDPRLQNDS